MLSTDTYESWEIFKAQELRETRGHAVYVSHAAMILCGLLLAAGVFTATLILFGHRDTPGLSPVGSVALLGFAALFFASSLVQQFHGELAQVLAPLLPQRNAAEGPSA